MPVRERGREYWVMVDHPSRYDHLSVDDLVNLAGVTPVQWTVSGSTC